MDTGVARQADRRHGRLPGISSRARRDPIAGIAGSRVYERLRRARRKRVVFAEGEEEQVIRAAASFVNQGLGTALLVGARGSRARRRHKRLGIELGGGIEIINAALSQAQHGLLRNYLYERLQRHGYPAARRASGWSTHDRNHFAACMVALGDADAMVTGVTRNFSVALEDVRTVIDPKPGHRVIGVSLVVARGRTVLVADTAITEMPTAEDLADIAVEAAGVGPPLRLRAASRHACLLDLRPSGRGAFRQGERGGQASSTTSGSTSSMTATWPPMSRSIRELAAAYPFCRLSGPANVLIMPAFHSASISTKMLQELGGRHSSSARCWSVSTGRCRSCSSAPRIRSWSTWRRWPAYLMTKRLMTNFTGETAVQARSCPASSPRIATPIDETGAPDLKRATDLAAPPARQWLRRPQRARLDRRGDIVLARRTQDGDERL